MLLLQLIFITTLYCLPVNTGKSASEKDPNEETAKIFCNKLGLDYKSGIFKSSTTKANNEAFEICKSRFSQYIISKGKPEVEDMDNFIKICHKEREIPLLFCSLVIDHLKNYGYDLKTAGELLKTLTDRANYILTYVYKEIKLDYSLWEILRKIDNLHIEMCAVLYFTWDTQKKNAIMNSYINWLEDQKQNTVKSSDLNKPETENDHKKNIYCNCRQVFGLYEIYEGRKVNDLKVLYDYYSNFCTIDFPNRNLWSDGNLRCIAGSKKLINGAILKQFLTNGIFPAKSDWCQNGSMDWSFDRIYEITNLTENSVSQDAFEAISYAQKEHFGVNDYNQFLKVTAPYGNDFHTANCIKNVFKIAFNQEASNRVYSSQEMLKLWGYNPEQQPYYSRPVGGIKEEEKIHPFNIHVGLLLEIFRNTNPSSVTCNSTFLRFLSQFKSIVDQRNFSEEYVTRDLTEFAKKHTNTADLIQCYQFTLDLQQKITNTFFMLQQRMGAFATSSYNYFGYKLEFSEFTSELFKKPPTDLYQICRNENSQLNMNSETNILLLMKFVFKNIEFNNLEELFQEVNEETNRKMYRY